MTSLSIIDQAAPAACSHRAMHILVMNPAQMKRDARVGHRFPAHVDVRDARSCPDPDWVYPRFAFPSARMPIGTKITAASSVASARVKEPSTVRFAPGRTVRGSTKRRVAR